MKLSNRDHFTELEAQLHTMESMNCGNEDDCQNHIMILNIPTNIFFKEGHISR